ADRSDKERNASERSDNQHDESSLGQRPRHQRVQGGYVEDRLLGIDRPNLISYDRREPGAGRFGADHQAHERAWPLRVRDIDFGMGLPVQSLWSRVSDYPDDGARLLAPKSNCDMLADRIFTFKIAHREASVNQGNLWSVRAILGSKGPPRDQADSQSLEVVRRYPDWIDSPPLARR